MSDFSVAFDVWKAAVDAEIAKIAGGFTADDFSDWTYAEAFEDGAEPRQAAIDALANDPIGVDFLELAGLMDEVSW